MKQPLLNQKQGCLLSASALVLVIALSACVSVAPAPEPPRTTEWVAANLKIAWGDPYKETSTTYRTPFRYQGRNTREGHAAQLVHWDKFFALEVTVWADDWKFLKHAATNTGERLRTEVDDHIVGNAGIVTEKLSADLPNGFLQEHPDGFSVKFWGKRGEVVVEMPAADVQGFLAGIARQTASR